MRRSSVLVLTTLLFAGACSDDGGDATPESADVPATEVEEPTIDIDPAHVGLVDALGAMTLTTPESGGGERPVLAWEPVDGADHYAVVVLDPDGQPYWGWRTADTVVRVGVGDRAEGVPGPRVADGMTWSVVAHGADGIPVAASARRPIEP